MVGERGFCGAAEDRLNVFVPAHSLDERDACPHGSALAPKPQFLPVRWEMCQQERPQGILVPGFTWSQTEMSRGPGTALWVLGD